MTIMLEGINPLTGSVVVDGDMTPDTHPLSNAVRECEMCSNPFMYHENDEESLSIKTGRYNYELSTSIYTYYYICPTCTNECTSCGTRRPALDDMNYSYLLNTRYFKGMCESCSDEHYCCENCSDVIHQDDVEWISDSAYCMNCRIRISEWCSICDQYEYNTDLCTPHDDNIHNYGYKPDPVFYGQDKINSHLRFGIELEVEAKSGDLGEGSELMTNEWGDFCYLKEDSSLNFGFEIVTHPASLEYYQNEISWNTINRLRDLGFRSWNTSTCGLHVHIDRRAFKDRTHLLAFTYLLNNNTGLSQHLAGRNSREYAYIGSDSKHDNLNTIKGYGRGRGGDRYLAVNLQNSATVEIRMFKGSLKVERILSGIEYCHALVQYSRDIRSGNNASVMLRPEEFTSWIRKQGKYPNLVQFLPDFEVIEQDNNQMEE